MIIIMIWKVISKLYIIVCFIKRVKGNICLYDFKFNETISKDRKASFETFNEQHIVIVK